VRSQTPKSKSQENPKLQNPRGGNFMAETQRAGRGTQRRLLRNGKKMGGKKMKSGSWKGQNHGKNCKFEIFEI
jgi:hypothetical protein